MIRVMLVDDHPVVREGLRTMLQAEPDLQVAGEFADAEAALACLNGSCPDVVLMDLRLPGMNGIQAAAEVARRHPEVSVILLTVHDGPAYLLEALRAGAAGFLRKESSGTLIVHSVRAAVAGGCVVGRPLLGQALADQRDLASLQAVPVAEPRLTDREVEVLRLVAEGHGNRPIASKLNLAEVTVKKYVQSLIRKLGARDRTHAAILGARLGLLE